MPATIAALATYFGERPLDVRLYDSDPQRLDLFDRFARGCFLVQDCSHTVMSTTDPSEALRGANGVIFHVGLNCARKLGNSSAPDADLVRDVLAKLVNEVPEEAEVLSLQVNRDALPMSGCRYLPSEEPLTDEERTQRTFQILRWLRGEEPVLAYLGQYERSALKAWLEDPESIPLAQFG
jgi:hypothetical protein